MDTIFEASRTQQTRLDQNWDPSSASVQLGTARSDGVVGYHVSLTH